MRDLHAELKRDNIVGKSRKPRKGQKVNAYNLARGALYGMLQNPLYIGRVRHRDETFEGQHKAIIPEELWRAVQEKMADNRVNHPGKIHAGLNLLTGLLFGPKGEVISPTSTLKGGARYRYYVQVEGGSSRCKMALRISAGELEESAVKKLRNHLQEETPDESELLELLKSDDTSTRNSAVIRLVEKIVVHAHKITIQLKDGNRLSTNHIFSVNGTRQQIIVSDQIATIDEKQNHALLKTFVQGYIWRKQFFERPGSTVTSIAKAENKSSIYIARLINLSLVAPKVVVRILKNEAPAYYMWGGNINGLAVLWSKSIR